MIKILINGKLYELYDCMIKYMEILKIYVDCKSETTFGELGDVSNSGSQCVEILYDITNENLDCLMNCVCDPLYECSKNITDCLNIMIFMSYLGLSHDFVNVIIKKIANVKSSAKLMDLTCPYGDKVKFISLEIYINECCKRNYCDEMITLFDHLIVTHKWYKKIFGINIGKKFYFFPAHARKHILMKSLDTIIRTESCWEKSFAKCNKHENCIIYVENNKQALNLLNHRMYYHAVDNKLVEATIGDKSIYIYVPDIKKFYNNVDVLKKIMYIYFSPQFNT